METKVFVCYFIWLKDGFCFILGRFMYSWLQGGLFLYEGFGLFLTKKLMFSGQGRREDMERLKGEEEYDENILNN